MSEATRSGLTVSRVLFSPTILPPTLVRPDRVRFCLALEKAPAGSVPHTVGDDGVATLANAEVIARKLNVPTA